MKSLSSARTVLYKFILPPLWVIFIIIELVQPSRTGEEMVDVIIGMLLVLLYLGWIATVKKVRIDGDYFYVSNYFKKVKYHIDEVHSFSGLSVLNPDVVWIRLKTKSDFGRSIMFIPHFRISFGMTSHPVVKELNQMITVKDAITSEV